MSKCKANCGLYAVDGRRGYCTRCEPRSTSATAAAAASSQFVGTDPLERAAFVAGQVLGLGSGGLDGRTAPSGWDPAAREALAAKLTSAAADVDRLQAQLASKQRELREALMAARSQNREAWAKTTATLTSGKIVALDQPRDLARVVSVRSDGVVTVVPVQFIPDDGTMGPGPREVPFARVVAPDPEQAAAAEAAYQAAAARQAAAFAAPCPTPCPRCGHAYCYNYHHSDLSDLGGWALVCTSQICACFKCTRARRLYPKARSDEQRCCRCHPPIRNECNCDECRP